MRYARSCSWARAQDARPPPDLSTIHYGDPAPLAIADGGYGVFWAQDAQGELTGEIEVVSPDRTASDYLIVMVRGRGATYDVEVGPYEELYLADGGGATGDWNLLASGVNGVAH